MQTITFITTTHHVLAMDGNNRFYQVHTGSGLYYGLCYADRRLYVAARNNICGHQDEVLRAQERGTLLVFDDRLTCVQELQPEFPLRDLHGIAAIEGRIWMTCSFDNRIAIYDVAHNTWSEWFPSPHITARGRDVNHFNTVALFGDRLHLLAHNNGASEIYRFRYSDLQLDSVHQIGYQAHDMVRIDDDLLVCSSGEGVLTSESGWTLRTLGFPRGVSLQSTYTLVGISLHGRREERNTLTGVIRRYGRQWEHEADYGLSGAGMVLQILTVVMEDEALDRLKPFDAVEYLQARSNSLEPLNTYLPGKYGGFLRDRTSEWHEPEGLLRWTAALEARMDIFFNHDEEGYGLIVEAFNAFEGEFEVEIQLNETRIGVLQWTEPGYRTTGRLMSTGIRPGWAELKFRVPCLRRPSALLKESNDERLLGVAITRVSIDRPPPAT